MRNTDGQDFSNFENWDRELKTVLFDRIGSHGFLLFNYFPKSLIKLAHTHIISNMVVNGNKKYNLSACKSELGNFGE